MTDNLSYCNPLKLPDIPRGKDDWYPFEEKMFSHENRPEAVTGKEYRSVSDPTVMYYDGKWYLYPSYGMAYVTEDFVNWRHSRTEPYCPKYSPAVTRWNGGFLLTSWNCPLYYSDSPLGPFEELGAFILPDDSEYVPTDPALFTDDDGRLYLYAFDADGEYGTASYRTKITGCELDVNDPRKIITEPSVLFEMNPAEHTWERQGYNNQNTDFGWVEGPHMLRYNGRYYLIYACPDTRDPSYCLAVYYSDSSPLAGFVCQKNNPLTVSRSGIVSGAGHGSVERGPGNSLWAFYTVACPRNHQYERRIGMDRISVDENGELYCSGGVTDTPQYGPLSGKKGSLGYYNLTAHLIGKASSHKDGRDAVYASDCSNISCWVPSEDDSLPVLTFDLDDVFTAGAVRIFWAEINYDPGNGVMAGPVKYCVEGYTQERGWFILTDCSDNETDFNIDYRTFPEMQCRKVRLKISGKPEGLTVGVIDFSVFGRKK